MASIRSRNGKWQARITRKSEQPIAKSFQSKQDAERWARQIESEIVKGGYTNLVLADRTPFAIWALDTICENSPLMAGLRQLKLPPIKEWKPSAQQRN